MKEIICSVFIAVSLDGYIARKNGDIDWLEEPSQASEGEDYGYQAFFDSIDTLVTGRNTYEKVLTFGEWPYTGKRVVVMTSRSPQIPESLSGKVEFSSASPAELVRQLSDQGARHIYVDGGRTIQGFLQAGLIHDMTLTRIPILIGEGIPLFGPLDRDIRLWHIETRTYPNGFVQSMYRMEAIDKEGMNK